MLATWTGAKAGASWTITRPPLARSITIRSSAGIAFHALAGDCATTSLGVSSLGAAPPRATAAATIKTERILVPPLVALALAEPVTRRYPPPMFLATLMLLGSGELGREFTIAAKRLGCRVIACDRYANAPAMQMADAFEVLPMLDGAALRAAVEKHKPDII